MSYTLATRYCRVFDYLSFCVVEILDAKRQVPQADTNDLEKQID